MPNTYQLIASNTVGVGGVTTVTFSSIPQTYTDLVVKTSLRDTGIDNSVRFQFNSATGSSRFVFGDGATASSSSDPASMYIVTATNPASYTANAFANGELYIPNYTSSNFKSSSADGVTENNATTSFQALTANLWSSTSAITSITFSLSVAVSFVQYSTFTLYGIKNS
jgi:hypothetical protein